LDNIATKEMNQFLFPLSPARERNLEEAAKGVVRWRANSRWGAQPFELVFV